MVSVVEQSALRKKRKEHEKRISSYAGVSAAAPISSGSVNTFEYKYYPTATSINLATGQVATSVFHPARGNSNITRIGRKTVVKRMVLRFAVRRVDSQVPTQGVNLVAVAGRFIVVYDVQCKADGTVPVTTDVLLTDTQYSHYNLANRNRFKILHDSSWVADPYYLNGTGLRGAFRQVQHHEESKRGLNLTSIFNAAFLC